MKPIRHRRIARARLSTSWRTRRHCNSLIVVSCKNAWVYERAARFRGARLRPMQLLFSEHRTPEPIGTVTGAAHGVVPRLSTRQCWPHTHSAPFSRFVAPFPATQNTMSERLISSSSLPIALPFPGNLLCHGFESTALFENAIVQSTLRSFTLVSAFFTEGAGP